MPQYFRGATNEPAEVTIDWWTMMHRSRDKDTRIKIAPRTAENCTWTIKVYFVDESLADRPELTYMVYDVEVADNLVRVQPTPLTAFHGEINNYFSVVTWKKPFCSFGTGQAISIDMEVITLSHRHSTRLRSHF